ncbi:hypothetical protein [Actinophytocola sp.]|uniref:hypothetical protein n=1 Tax=Actinophytocola sp. TaxID=1872138 RepID=UPI002D46C437|nr:hypothetical protein [Actinophytocola sp.]HYQ61838.1 hypothetical protein [Actinophytocola sp.]
MGLVDRVTPTGEIVVAPLVCRWLGKRGVLHEGDTLVRSHQGTTWTVCDQPRRYRRQPRWPPGQPTVLFFHDEAVALAAGHRPCDACRPKDFDAYRKAVAGRRVTTLPSAAEIDSQLHDERLDPDTGRRRLHTAKVTQLPVGTFVLLDDGPAMIQLGLVSPWTQAKGYVRPSIRPARGTVQVLTPPSTVEALRNGYRPQTDIVVLHSYDDGRPNGF